MSAVLGHELRNPLAALKGHAQLLVERTPEGACRTGARTIVREAIRLEELAEHVLAFARTGTVDRIRTDPAVVVRTAVEALGDVRATVHLPADTPLWPLDGVRLEQAVANLVRNALQSSPPDQPVEVTLAVDGDRLTIDVRDHGDGIALGEEERIFEPFHTTRTRGTGLGLTVSRRIVEGHGGTIRARNHPTGGAVFAIELPRESEET
jgi:two-component system sensor histidine kinase HydH